MNTQRKSAKELLEHINKSQQTLNDDASVVIERKVLKPGDN